MASRRTCEKTGQTPVNRLPTVAYPGMLETGDGSFTAPDVSNSVKLQQPKNYKFGMRAVMANVFPLHGPGLRDLPKMESDISPPVGAGRVYVGKRKMVLRFVIWESLFLLEVECKAEARRHHLGLDARFSDLGLGKMDDRDPDSGRVDGGLRK